MKNLKAKLLISTILISVPILIPVTANAATSSICNAASCDNPQPATVFGQNSDRSLNRPAPINVCEVLNNWKIDAVIQVVGGVLKVNWVYTLVPSLVCHLVGWNMKYRLLTGCAVLFTWIGLFLLNLADNGFAILIPVAVLAFFQIGEKRYLKNFSNRKGFSSK